MAKSKPINTDSKYNSNTILIGNSKFFKRLTKKDESGEIICNDEFDTISLDRLATLERTSVVNRSNRSCPGFKISLPNISENTELSDSRESLHDCIENSACNSNISLTLTNNVEAINSNPKIVNIFEPRDEIYPKCRISSGSAESAVNDCYESIDFYKNIVKNIETPDVIPKPLPRSTLTKQKNTFVETIYENIVIDANKNNNVPKPAVRNCVSSSAVVDNTANNSLYENVKEIETKITPEPPKRNLPVSQEVNKNINVHLRSLSVSTSSTASSDSLDDETHLEDILLSAKSKSFRHKAATRCDSSKSDIYSVTSDTSDITEASALDHVDCSDNNMYLTMSGTLPNKKTEVPKKAVLFRNKTFSIIEVDKPTTIARDFPRYTDNEEFLKDTLAHYHIRGTGHCIYKAPTVEEFISIFNRETLCNDNVEALTKVTNRDSYFETAICFCKPSQTKFHKSAEDLLDMYDGDRVEKVKIDTMSLMHIAQINSTSFCCYCDDDSCKFHVRKRQSPSNLIIKFSAIKKSLSTPDLTLPTTPVSRKPGLVKNMSFPSAPDKALYAVVDTNKKVFRNQTSQEHDVKNESKIPYSSQASTLSTNSGRPYSLKDVAEVLSLAGSTSSDVTNLPYSALSESFKRSCSQRQSSSSEQSTQISLKSCNSFNSSVSSNSFKSCIEELDSDDETLQSDVDAAASDAETVKSDSSGSQRPWVQSNSFRFANKDPKLVVTKTGTLKGSVPIDTKVIRDDSSSESDSSYEGMELEGRNALGVASLECGLRARDAGRVRSGSGRRRWDEAECTSEGDALSVSSAASSSAPHHLAHHHEYSKVSVSLACVLLFIFCAPFSTLKIQHSM